MKTRLILLAAAALAGCASLPGRETAADGAAPKATVREAATAAAAAAPPVWYAPLPAGSVSPGAAWTRIDEPALLPLLRAAEAASPTLSQAALRIAQARASRAAAAAVLLPQLGANASVQRGGNPAQSAATTASAGLQLDWDLDLFGGASAARQAAEARLAATEAEAPALRLATAVETATTLLELRACEAQARLTRDDASSRAETARLTQVAARAGLRAPADAALAQAGAAQARAQDADQRARCELLVKSLVELTALNEPELRTLLAAATGRLPQAPAPQLDTLPAALLQQRPDLTAAAARVVAAAAEQRQAEAAQLPQVALSGTLGGMRLWAAPASASGSSWSLGPLVMTLPLFDGGRRDADAAAARAAYDDAVRQLQANVRSAVREVEQALVRLDAAERRRTNASAAVQGFEVSLAAVEARWRGGLASLFELEDARRSALSARASLVELEREHLAAWIALARALGGGWMAG